MSYHGKIGFGLLADYDSMEDIELLGAGINNALAELEAAASESPPRRSSATRPGRAAARRGYPLRMGLLLVLLFIVVPIAELFVIIQVGEWIGVVLTLLLFLLDAVLGSWLLKREGRARSGAV